jgi:ectoine hydroxylase-related dioxygenase (phytanoyl-CoA dioxygenase family)
MSVDIRTRVDGQVESVDAAACFEEVLPAAFEGERAVLAAAVAEYAPRPLVIEVDGDAWTLAVDGGVVRIAPGRADDAESMLRLSGTQLDDLVNDQVTVVGLQTNGTLDQPVGHFDALLDWWLLLRGALDGRAPHTKGAIDLVDADGAPLALDRGFPGDAPLDEMGDFLERAGYLHLEGVFDEEEMAAVSRDMDAAAPLYTRGDGRSWWARNRAGDDLLVRMQYFDEVSAAVERLVADERLQRLAELTRDHHVYGGMKDNRIEALFKPFDVVEGISDLPWHKDCALGRHSYDCCSMTVGISVTGADAVSGQLRVVAGSHRALMWPSLHRENSSDLPVVPLPTRTGDVTVHLSCTLHQSVPPQERERRVLYTGFRLPPRGTAAEREALERLRAIREDAPVKAPSANRA